MRVGYSYSSGCFHALPYVSVRWGNRSFRLGFGIGTKKVALLLGGTEGARQIISPRLVKHPTRWVLCGFEFHREASNAAKNTQL
jgi:hypothetical protein